MKISRTIAYAIHASLQLAHGSPNKPIPCSELARAGSLPERFLLRILRSLVTRGLLESTRGVDGGYYLSRSPKEITLRDIVEAFDNPLEVTFPVLANLSPAVRSRILSILQDAAEAARARLATVSLADLIQAGASTEVAARTINLHLPGDADDRDTEAAIPPIIH